MAKKKTIKIDCSICPQGDSCCESGTWVDLEEAKKILRLGLKGEFFHLEKDKDFPSGYRIGTSIGYEKCSFLDPDGLCSIHKIDFNLKPLHCKEFPYENGKIAPYAKELCILFPEKKKRAKKKRKGR